MCRKSEKANMVRDGTGSIIAEYTVKKRKEVQAHYFDLLPTHTISELSGTTVVGS